MFCGKKLNHKINEIHKRTLRCVYKDYHLSFEELIKRYNEYSIHTKNLQSLMLFFYRILHRKSPDICVGSFRQKHINYSFRSKSILSLPMSNSHTFGINSIIFKGSLLWNNLPNSYKDSSSDLIFKRRIKNWSPRICTCKICK